MLQRQVPACPCCRRTAGATTWMSATGPRWKRGSHGAARAAQVATAAAQQPLRYMVARLPLRPAVPAAPCRGRAPLPDCRAVAATAPAAPAYRCPAPFLLRPRLLSFLREEAERERLEEIERLKPIGTQVGPYTEYRCARGTRLEALPPPFLAPPRQCTLLREAAPCFVDHRTLIVCPPQVQGRGRPGAAYGVGRVCGGQPRVAAQRPHNDAGGGCQRWWVIATNCRAPWAQAQLARYGRA